MKRKALVIVFALTLALAISVTALAADGVSIRPDSLNNPQYYVNSDGITVITPTPGNVVWLEVSAGDWISGEAYLYGGSYNGWHSYITVYGPYSPGYMQILNAYVGQYRVELRQGGTVLATYFFIVGPPCTHSTTHEVTIDEPTCLEPGSANIVCSNCGAIRGWTEIEALGHEWDDGIYTEPTLEADGFYTFICQRENCGETKVIVDEGSKLSIVNVKVAAYVIKLNGNTNDLVITVTEEYSNQTSADFTKTVSIMNNSAGTYLVDENGIYMVYVDTKGNDQIRACYLVM